MSKRKSDPQPGELWLIDMGLRKPEIVIGLVINKTSSWIEVLEAKTNNVLCCSELSFVEKV